MRLSDFSKIELEKRELNSIKGGDLCDNLCGTVKPSHGGTSNTWRSYYYD